MVWFCCCILICLLLPFGLPADTPLPGFETHSSQEQHWLLGTEKGKQGADEAALLPVHKIFPAHPHQEVGAASELCNVSQTKFMEICGSMGHSWQTFGTETEFPCNYCLISHHQIISDHEINFAKFPTDRSAFFMVSYIFLFSLKSFVLHVWTELNSIIFTPKQRPKFSAKGYSSVCFCAERTKLYTPGERDSTSGVCFCLKEHGEQSKFDNNL